MQPLKIDNGETVESVSVLPRMVQRIITLLDTWKGDALLSTRGLALRLRVSENHIRINARNPHLAAYHIKHKMQNLWHNKSTIAKLNEK
jgi:hypothetical protein